MRESIGTVSLLNFIIFFILLVFAFLMGTFSYYKAYRVNNAIVSAIEKYEGFNQYSEQEIDNKLKTLGYNRVDFNCPKKNGADLLSINETEPEGSTKTHVGYCVYAYNNDTTYSGNTDIYDTYEVTTVITFQFPIIQDLLKLRVSSKTGRIYNFVSSKNNMRSQS